MQSLDTPIAIVTGAGSGIGRATALALGRVGLSVMLVGRRAGALEETAGHMPSGAEAHCVPMDVSDPASGEEMVAACLACFGRLDVLVNNAGVAPLLPIDQTDAATVQNVYMTNSVGPACAIAAAWKVFKKQHAEENMGRLGHRIVNISTLGTDDPFPGFFAYASSKAAVNLMVKSCAMEGKAIGVRAFAIAPGAVETEMLRAIFTKTQLPEANCLTPQNVADKVVSCVLGELDVENGRTIYMRKA